MRTRGAVPAGAAPLIVQRQPRQRSRRSDTSMCHRAVDISLPWEPAQAQPPRADSPSTPLRMNWERGSHPVVVSGSSVVSGCGPSSCVRTSSRASSAVSTAGIDPGSGRRDDSLVQSTPTAPSALVAIRKHARRLVPKRHFMSPDVHSRECGPAHGEFLSSECNSPSNIDCSR